jgi:hypothetical protein
MVVLSYMVSTAINNRILRRAATSRLMNTQMHHEPVLNPIPTRSPSKNSCFMEHGNKKFQLVPFTFNIQQPATQPRVPNSQLQNLLRSGFLRELNVLYSRATTISLYSRKTDSSINPK